MTEWQAARHRVAASLHQWAEAATDEQARTVVVRPAATASVDEAVRDLEGLGARVASAGPGAIVVDVTPAALRRAAGLPWVVAIQPPSTLGPA